MHCCSQDISLQKIIENHRIENKFKVEIYEPEAQKDRKGALCVRHQHWPIPAHFSAKAMPALQISHKWDTETPGTPHILASH